MKYCVTLQLRKSSGELSQDNIPIFNSLYYESNSVRDLNDWIYHHICNTYDNDEIINFLFEVS